jgi:hypothetical protein
LPSNILTLCLFDIPDGPSFVDSSAFITLLQPGSVLDRLPQHRHAGFRHGAGRIDIDLADAELRNGKRHGVVAAC